MVVTLNEPPEIYRRGCTPYSRTTIAALVENLVRLYADNERGESSGKRPGVETYYTEMR